MIVFFSGDGDHGKRIDPELHMGANGNFMLSYHYISTNKAVRARFLRFARGRRPPPGNSIVRQGRSATQPQE